MKDLMPKLEAKAPLIDVREVDEYQAGHIPDAINIPLTELDKRYQEVPNGAYIVCQSGNRSQVACEFLAAHGIEATNVIEGTNGFLSNLC